MSQVQQIESTQQFDKAINQGVTLIDFFAPWCGPCRQLAPVLEDIAGKCKGTARVAKVNVDDLQDLAQRYRVSSIPTLIVFKDGKAVEQFVGMTSPKELKAAIDIAASA